MVFPDLQTRRWSHRRLEIRGWFTRSRLMTGGEVDDVLLREFFAAVDVPGGERKHFQIVVVEVEPEELP